MADEEKKPEQPKKIIDVTKPKNQAPPPSSIDASRVSAYTLREQQSLERLKKKVGNLDQKENKASSIKTIVAIVLVVILILLAIAFIIVSLRVSPPSITTTLSVSPRFLAMRLRACSTHDLWVGTITFSKREFTKNFSTVCTRIGFEPSFINCLGISVLPILLPLPPARTTPKTIISFLYQI